MPWLEGAVAASQSRKHVRCRRKLTRQVIQGNHHDKQDLRDCPNHRSELDVVDIDSSGEIDFPDDELRKNIVGDTLHA